MANLQDNSEEGVSLFPMFNILACTLGVMVFVLATVAVVSLGADRAVEYISDDYAGSMGGRLPTWIEWDGAELTLLPSEESVVFDQDLRSIPTFDQTYNYIFTVLAGSPVGRELSAASLDGNRFVILLVRPSGFRTLPEVRGYLELLGVDVVPEPIDQDLRRLQVR
ncbi:MAG: hypothetical protein OEN56_03815 [Gemmatimonadota bacterium]|nr:hypothetical protein [Gemmatimonadota bacterium]